VKAWLENAGHVVSRVDIPKPGQHPHAVIMGLLLLLMAAFGLFALALSGVIVLNLVLAILAGERRQIGVMKAVGGTRAQIAQVYLAEAATFGLAALALALPIGVQGGRALSRYFAGLLNFDLNSLAAPWWLFVAAAIVALVVPIGAAAYPVAIATDITVREALSATGLAVTTFGAGRFDRLLCKIDTGGRPLLLGVRNSLRRRTRTALTLITLAIAGAFFISALSVRTSLMATVDRRFGASTYGADFRYAFDQHMLMIYVFLLVVSAVLASVAGLGLMTATSLNVLERRRELGVLRTIGATPPMVASIVILEAVFVATVAWALAVLSAWGIARGVNALVPAVTLFKDGVDFSLSAVGVAGWLLISVAIALVSSAVSAVAGARGSIREAIGYE
jgi:putative ABC transport system permease protein